MNVFTSGQAARHKVGVTAERKPGARTAFSLAVVVGGSLLLPVGLFGQKVEEHDRDDPPAEQPEQAPAATRADLSATARKIVEGTNDFRKRQDRAVLKTDRRLKETAQYFAEFMAKTGKYGHTADGKRPSERARNHGYDYCIVAENIAYQFRTTGFTADELADRLVNGWEQSPEHRKNMLDPDVTETGVAVARKKDSPTYFAVQLFGRPQSKAITFRVTDKSNRSVSYSLQRRGSTKTFELSPGMQRTHQRCRPTTIEFDGPLKTTRQVEDGAHYVVGKTSDGKLELTGER